jgi:hypothetical protein
MFSKKPSSKIKRLPTPAQSSNESDIPAQAYVSSIIDTLFKITRRIEGLDPKDHPRIHWGQQSSDKEQKKWRDALCMMIVDRANEISTVCKELGIKREFPSKIELVLPQQALR